MSIMHKILEDYLERNFRVKPDLSESNRMYEKMNKFKDSLALSEEQKKKFEDLFFEMSCDYQESGFYDGFKTAFDLMSEIAK